MRTWQPDTHSDLILTHAHLPLDEHVPTAPASAGVAHCRLASGTVALLVSYVFVHYQADLYILSRAGVGIKASSELSGPRAKLPCSFAALTGAAPRIACSLPPSDMGPFQSDSICVATSAIYINAYSDTFLSLSPSLFHLFS